MRIEKQKSKGTKFAVNAGISFETGAPEVHNLSFQLGEDTVILNKEEVEELKKVLAGDCKKIFAYSNKEAEEPHSAVYVTSNEGENEEVLINTEVSFATF